MNASEPPPPYDRRALRRALARAAPDYDAHAVLQREVARRMAERLDLVNIAPAQVIDLGCGTGADLGPLAQRYPKARVLGLDLAPELLRAGTPRPGVFGRLAAAVGRGGPLRACADAARLPLSARSLQFVWSNLMLQQLADPAPALREIRRVLEPGGLLMFSTLGPDTLKELRAAFAAVDGGRHVHGFIDMHDMGDMLVGAGFAEPVMDMERITLTYEHLRDLVRDLRAAGAVNVAPERRRGLATPRAWAVLEAACDARRQEGRLAATFEIVYGHAWCAEPRTSEDGRAIVRFERRPAR